MKTRDTVVLANDEEVPLELYNHVASADIRWDWCNMNLTYECNTPGHYECKKCEGTPVCAWKSYYHTSGPKYCGTDDWMEKPDACPGEPIMPVTPVPDGSGAVTADHTTEVASTTKKATTTEERHDHSSDSDGHSHSHDHTSNSDSHSHSHVHTSDSDGH